MLIVILVLVLFHFSQGESDITFEEFLDVPAIIAKYGYPTEVHHVTTNDGYILTLQRIPHGKHNKTKSKKPVLLQHGLLCSSANFVTSGPNSIAFMLADSGYDVWLGNGRGNHESRNHTTLNPNTDSKFWEFSWHEIGVTDLPAMIDYICRVSGLEKIFYIGYSQGTTTFFVMASSRTEYNAKIRAHFQMAPIGYASHTNSFLRLLSHFVETIEAVAKGIGTGEYFPYNKTRSKILILICTVVPKICGHVMFVVLGNSPDEMNYQRFPVLIGHLPMGISSRQLWHYGQCVKSGHFRQYDFQKDNVKVYGSKEPPEYDLSLITAPGYFYYSTKDSLSVVEDVEKTCKKMVQACVKKHLLKDNDFNHADWLYGKKAPELVYSKIISEMDQL